MFYITLCFHCDLGASSQRRITSKVRFRIRLLHPGHVSCLIGAIPLHCLPCTIMPRRLTHCDYASHRYLFRARDFIPFHLSSLISFFRFLSFLLVFFLTLCPLREIDRSFQISQLDQSFKAYMLFVSRIIYIYIFL